MDQFDKTPKDFLKDKFLIPNNFNDPENLDHGIYLDAQLKEDLFSLSYSKIQRIEGKYLQDDEDYFKLKKIQECQEGNSKLQDYLEKRLIDKDDDLIRCEDWIIEFRDKHQSSYRVKTYQSETDRFYSVVLGDTYYKNFKLHFSTFMSRIF